MSVGITKLKSKIRHAEEPNNPGLIPLWLTLEEIEIGQEPSLRELRKNYESQFHLLLETVADELVPSHWRQVCLDNIYKPLTTLQRMINDDESRVRLSALMRELSVTSRYVEKSLFL